MDWTSPGRRHPQEFSVLAIVLTAMLIGFQGGIAEAHKGRLPEDALTLVRQASALLAQNPAMVGEVRERLEAALKSKKPEGVHLEQVAEALRALEKKDITGARRLLLGSIMPAGMPMPPEGPRGRSAQPAPTRPPAGTLPAQPLPVQPPQASSVDAAMNMAEPLRARFTGTAAEIGVLAIGLVLVGLGLFASLRSREPLKP